MFMELRMNRENLAWNSSDRMGRSASQQQLYPLTAVQLYSCIW